MDLTTSINDIMLELKLASKKSNDDIFFLSLLENGKTTMEMSLSFEDEEELEDVENAIGGILLVNLAKEHKIPFTKESLLPLVKKGKLKSEYFDFIKDNFNQYSSKIKPLSFSY